MGDKQRRKFRIEFLPKGPAGAKASRYRRGSHILVVDDEPIIIRLMQVSLERHGYHVDTAGDGAEALAKIGRGRPDLIVSDVAMPEMDGIELVLNVRRDQALKDLPVILLITKPGAATVACAAGADMYLTKPFNPAELVASVKRLLAPDHPGWGYTYGEQPDGSYMIIDF